MSWRCYLEEHPELGGYKIYLGTAPDVPGKTGVHVSEIIMQTHTIGDLIEPASLPTLDWRDSGMLQALVDECYRKGIKPNAMNDKSELAATAKHLTDMRAIAFDRLKIERP